MNQKTLALIVSSLIFMFSANAFVLRVPEEYATIQSALDSTDAWDTVLVAPGVYNEFLIDPDHPFTLAGWYAADTLIDLRTILDPIPVAGIDTPSVFVVTGDTASIRNFAFFNRPELRQTGAATRSGAIRNYSHRLQLENCVFDSVSSAIWGGNHVIMEDCQFRGCVGQCVIPFIGGSVEAGNCFFESGSYALVTAYSNSRFDNCNFACNTTGGHFLNQFGSNVLISGCKFGPCVGGFAVVYVNAVQNVLVDNCLFEGLDNTTGIIQVQAECSHSIEAPITIRRSTFHSYHPVPPRQGGVAVDCQCVNSDIGLACRLENNLFVDGEVSGALTPGVQAWASIELYHNTLDSLFPAMNPDVIAVRPAQDTIFARDNSFLPPGLAASTAGSYFDARENWWGDSTGPYNINENPEGQGTEVGNGVLFIPWLRESPDTTMDTTNISVEDGALAQPASYALKTFPNPFNPFATIEYTLAREQDVTLEIYDVLGRLVETLFSGRQTVGVHTSKWNADAFASGLYFARLSSSKSNGNRQAVKLLLMK